jgi:plasmid stabilization system protein ParE
VIELTWSPQSLRDLEGIRAYIALDSPVYADAMVRRFIAAVEHLKAFPDSGRMVPERNEPQIREVILGAYRIVYRRRLESVEIATVFRASRMFPDLSTQ